MPMCFSIYQALGKELYYTLAKELNKAVRSMVELQYLHPSLAKVAFSLQLGDGDLTQGRTEQGQGQCVVGILSIQQRA